MAAARGEETLDELFRRTPVALLEQLLRALKTTSRTTVFRALTAVGYLTSYSHAGRYYTLKRIPKFDVRGLWFYRDVRFSSHGTLRATADLMIKNAPSGHTHEELQAILGLRVHDTLRSLVEAGQIARELTEGLYVYVDPEAATAQLARRREAQTPDEAATSRALDLARVIDVLLAVIRKPNGTAVMIAKALRARGLGVTDAQVEEVFARYELRKKTAPSRSRRSRR